MADPVSAAASIIAVIQISGSVLSACYKYVGSVKDAPRDIGWIINEVGSLKVVLDELKQLVESASYSTSPEQSGPSIPVASISDDKNKGGLSSSDHSNAPIISAPDHYAPFRSWSSDHSALLKSLNAAHGPLTTCQTALNAIHDKIGNPQGHSKAIGMLTWPLKEKAVQKILEVIQKQKSNLILALAADQARAVSTITESFEDNAKVTSQMMASLEQNVAITLQIRDTIQDAKLKEKREAILLWLRWTDPSTNHIAATEIHEPGTGQWLLESLAFQKWKNNPGELLFLHGISGCGKSVLSSTIIKHIKDHCDPVPDTEYAYYYFDFSNAEKRKRNSMVQSIMCQLISQRGEIPREIESLYDKNERRPQPEKLVPALFSMLEPRHRTYLILDALDECLERAELLTLIKHIHSSPLVRVNILVTSRREYDITTTLDNLATRNVAVESATVDADIQLYVHNCLMRDPVLGRWPAIVKSEIEEALINKAGGMFRWADCQLDRLRKCRNQRTLRQSLQILPDTLYETYDRILFSVPDTHQAEAQAALLWLAFSEIAMTLGEVADAVSVDRQSERYSIEDRFFDVHDILEICSSFVSLSETTDKVELSCGRAFWRAHEEDPDALPDDLKIVMLAHFSVKEYIIARINKVEEKVELLQTLVSNGMEAQKLMAETCLIYLLSFHEAFTIDDDFCNEYPFVDCAASYWYHHYKKTTADVSDKATTLTMSLFDRQNGFAYLNWMKVRYHCGIGYDRTEGLEDPLYFACRKGLLTAVRLLIDKAADLNAQGGKWGTPLVATAAEGYTDIMQVLLHAGAQVNDISSVKGTALHAAIRGEP